MVERYEEGKFWRLYQELKAGRITRREFIARATALGVAFPVVLFVLNATKAPGTAAQSAPASRPAVGMENVQRGAGGELRILQWQAATHLSVHNSTGTKDTLAAALVTEALTDYLPDGTLIPNLITEVPTVENGLLSPDLKSVTYKLLPNVVWSDGEPFTADDVIFTWQWIVDPANQSVDQTTYEAIENIEKIDDLTVRVVFKNPSLAWYFPFSGTSSGGGIYPKHFWDGKDPQAANDEFRRNPIGTGPYKVESFTENDQVTYVINENYREPNKPFFSRVIIKGGGDAASAAQAVLQTGDWHFAWNLQVADNILAEMERQGGKGKVVAQGNGAVERILINFSDPNDESLGERSHKDVPHPFLSDKAVRLALSLATDRQTISQQFYRGEEEPPAVNILTGIAAYESPNTSWEFNLDKARQVLEEAGWGMGGDVRRKGDLELRVSYFTSINPVRQQTQAVNKQNWEAIGFKVQLGQVDAGVFFDSAAGNDQNANHFFRDLQMYTNNPTSTFPLTYMQSWYAGPNGENIAQKSNGWSGLNDSRYQNPEFDALYESLLTETDPERAAETFIKMNDILIDDIAIIPIVNRAAEKFAIANGFVEENIAGSLFEALYWNIANWVRIEE